MSLEAVALEVGASKAGMTNVKPPVVRGHSGVEHKFSFLASDGSRNYAFDLYDSVKEIEVLKTYIKEYDTGVSAFLVSQGKPTPGALALASEYRMRILNRETIGSVFEQRVVKTVSS
ncbi:MAG: hypothetical protein HY296_03260 [Thaumarchaeota archaeon]|nr:hypothetical protein [Nitrososphaerota archaeon]